MRASARGQGPVPGHARDQRRRAAVRVLLLQRGQTRSLSFTRDVRLPRQMYPGRQILRRVSDDTRLVVCEPIGDLPAAWNEAPEASYGVIGVKDMASCSPSPRAPAEGPVTGYGPDVRARRPIVPRTSGHLALTRGLPSADCYIKHTANYTLQHGGSGWVAAGRCRQGRPGGTPAGDSAEPGMGGQNEVGSSRSGGVAGVAGAGRDGTRRHGARRATGDGARGGRDHAGRGGGVRAPGPVRRRRCAGRPGAGADARRGAGGAAGADAVPGGDRDPGVHEPGRPRPRAGPAPPAGRGRRGISGLPGWWRQGSRRTVRPGWPP